MLKLNGLDELLLLFGRETLKFRVGFTLLSLLELATVLVMLLEHSGRRAKARYECNYVDKGYE